MLGNVREARAEFEFLTSRSRQRLEVLGLEWQLLAAEKRWKDAATVGGATVGGAILGRILDHGDGDVIGGLLGAAAGTAVAHQKVGQPITLGSGAVIHMHLRAPIDVRVRN